MYQRLLEVVIEELYGLCSASNRKKVIAPDDGIFGTNEGALHGYRGTGQRHVALASTRLPEHVSGST